jgi:hypothetical protein
LSLPVAAHRLPAGLAVLVWVSVRHQSCSCRGGIGITGAGNVPEICWKRRKQPDPRRGHQRGRGGHAAAVDRGGWVGQLSHRALRWRHNARTMGDLCGHRDTLSLGLSASLHLDFASRRVRSPMAESENIVFGVVYARQFLKRNANEVRDLQAEVGGR